MTDEFMTFQLVEGEVLPCTIEGYTVEVKAVLESISDIQNIVIGVIPLKGDTLSKLVGAISTAYGKSKRVQALSLMNSISVGWPIDTQSGIPAYIEGCAIIKHDGNGGRIMMDIVDPEDE